MPPGVVVVPANVVGNIWLPPQNVADIWNVPAFQADINRGAVPLDAEVAAVLPAFDDLTIKQLRAYAAEKGIDLGKATRKADIIALL